ncbi:MAG TPA: DNA repair protein RecO [Gemmatimonadales bacterium]|nr:DNA repair protein RecO [Gemmatimonadales bacterium]
MSLVTTPAVVLQTYRYSETSKVVRLATRELGVQSALAKGALRPKSRFGAGLELLSEGTAQIYFRETRELHTLGAFDLTNLRRELAAEVGRFAGAAALAEVMLKMAPPAPLPRAYDVLLAALDALAAAAAERTDATAVRAIWQLLAVLGFEPLLTTCVRDGAPIAPTGEPVLFSIAEGGAFCSRCSPSPAHPAPPTAQPHPPTRLPPQAYRDLVALNDPRADLPTLDPAHTAAHRRLVARFVRYHLGEAGSLSALDFWERRAWTSSSPPFTSLPSAVS